MSVFIVTSQMEDDIKGRTTLPVHIHQRLCFLVNKDVDIKFSAHDAFLEKPPSRTLGKIGKPKKNKVLETIKTIAHTCLYNVISMVFSKHGYIIQPRPMC